MPTLSLERENLFTKLGREYSDKEFEELCFEFGVELDEITSEREEAVKSSTVTLSKDELSKLSSNVIYKIDVPANRYDLLCIEGMSRALKIFLGDIECPTYAAILGETFEKMIVYPSVSNVRPHVVCAILRDVKFTPQNFKSFIDLQEQLHRNICRHRKLVAIGTHDFGTIKGPFEYRAKVPEDIKFIPLTHETEFESSELMEIYLTDPGCKHLKPYVPLIHSSPVYPVILDSEGTVLSLPPIINGSKSKITLDTKDVFIECTATDLTKANIVLDTMVTMFSEYCAEKFSVEPVFVNYVTEEGNEISRNITPQLFTRTERASVDFINSMIGVNIEPEYIVELCQKMQLSPAKLISNKPEFIELDDDLLNPVKLEDEELFVEVTIPPTRSDILHPVDIAEDIGVAFGFNNIPTYLPTSFTVGAEQPMNKLVNLLRQEIAQAGYMEVLTHALCSLRDNFTALRRTLPSEISSAAVSLSNPANTEYEIVRTTLLPGLLKTLQHNKKASFAKGFKIFEISDVVIPDSTHTYCQTRVGAKNLTKICAVYAGSTSGFQHIHGLLDRIFTLCEISPAPNVLKSSKTDETTFLIAREDYVYYIQEETLIDPVFFPGRAANVLLSTPNTNGQKIKVGMFGILHPQVLKNFGIVYPASCLELDLSPLL